MGEEKQARRRDSGKADETRICFRGRRNSIDVDSERREISRRIDQFSRKWSTVACQWSTDPQANFANRLKLDDVMPSDRKEERVRRQPR
jgi:hypothetical protein